MHSDEDDEYDLGNYYYEDDDLEFFYEVEPDGYKKQLNDILEYIKEDHPVIFADMILKDIIK